VKRKEGESCDSCAYWLRDAQGAGLCTVLVKQNHPQPAFGPEWFCDKWLLREKAPET
jgi:hypothetical protein